MVKKLKGYVLSEIADNDLEAIFDYTIFQFSTNQAIKYLTDLDTVFENLVINPKIGRTRTEIKKGLFSITEQEHVIFYRIQEGYIRIVRVLHGSKDLPKHF